VLAFTCSREVHVGVLRSLQPPLEETEMPAAESWETACEWDSLDCALATAARAAMRAN